MSDSRITVTLSEVRAASELIDNAYRRIDELLDEDPAFSLGVQANLNGASSQLDECAAALMAAVSILQAADELENGRTA